ncbi:MAG: helix-turn-helix domain-containing protein [Myxococcales bacterium]
MSRNDTDVIRKRARSAAVRLFSQFGFEGTSVQAIADAIGISKQALLYHFESKEGLRKAALEEMVDTWRAVLPRFLAVLTRPNVPFDEAFSEIVDFFRGEPAYPRFLMQVLLQPPGEGRGAVDDVEPWLKMAGDFIRRAQEDGLVDRAVDPDAWIIEIGILILASLSLLGEPSQGGNVPDQSRLLREMARIAGSSLVGPRKTTTPP